MTKLQLKALQAKWKKKLKDSGFEDIEDGKGNLKEYHSYRYNSKKIKRGFFEKQRYYELAGQLLHSFPFSSPRNKAIWAMHVDGRSNADIADKLDISDEAVERVIRHLAGHIKHEND